METKMTGGLNMKARPQNRHLKPFKPIGTESMTGRLFVRVTPEIEKIVRSLPNSSTWLRRVIYDAVKREMFEENGSNSSTRGEPPYHETQ